jgi:tripartite-type tricarboxylate transporter receptor subunit TctC
LLEDREDAMKRRGLSYSAILVSFVTLFVVLSSTNAICEEAGYPSKPVKLMCPYSAGGTTDLAARTLASALPDFLGQPVVVVNKPGASGSICFDYTMKVKPDGYQMMMAAIGSNALYPAMNPNLPFKYDDLVYLARTQINPNMLVVSAKSPWNKFEDLAKALKENPGKYKYSTAGPGTTSHLGACLLLQALGLPISAASAVHYNSDGEAVLALIQGEVDFFQANLAPMDSHVKGGLVRGLAVTTDKRLPGYDQIPTYTELGYPTVDVIGWRGICGPKGLPENVVKAWETAVEKTTGSKYWTTVITKFGDVPGYMDSKQFSAFVDKEFKRYRKLFDELGLLMKK